MRKLSRKGRHGFAVDAMERTEAVAGQVTDETSHPSSGTRITGRLRAAPAGVFVVAVLQATHGITATITRKVRYRLCSTRSYRGRRLQLPHMVLQIDPRVVRFSPLLIGAGGCSGRDGNDVKGRLGVSVPFLSGQAAAAGTPLVAVRTPDPGFSPLLIGAGGCSAKTAFSKLSHTESFSPLLIGAGGCSFHAGTQLPCKFLEFQSPSYRGRRVQQQRFG
jgi:hypothetical protein